MTYWVWDDSLNLGIDVIDSQHRRIVDFINDLQHARITKDSVIISEALLGLIDYTATHFIFEEELIVLAHYPLVEAHKESHTAFTTRIHKYRRQHEHGHNVLDPLMSELKLWLIQHIEVDDKKYVTYVKKSLQKNWVDETILRLFGRVL